MLRRGGGFSKIWQAVENKVGGQHTMSLDDAAQLSEKPLYKVGKIGSRDVDRERAKS